MKRLTSHAPPPDSLGHGRYLFQGPVGTGSMATVYHVLDAETQQHRALKLLLPHNARLAKTRERFLREAKTMTAMHHRHIVPIVDVGEEDGYYYFVMELALGGNLAQRLKKHGPRPPIEALCVTYQILLGLEYAHGQGVVHRDVKPHNMLFKKPMKAQVPREFSLDEPPCWVQLSDFGIARTLGDTSANLTGTGDTLGTLAYMSPEQRQDPREVLPTSDIYGAGAQLYMMVTGRRPFDLSLIQLDPRVLQRVPEPLQELVLKSTAIQPEDRYQSAREMSEAIQQLWGALGR